MGHPIDDWTSARAAHSGQTDAGGSMLVSPVDPVGALTIEQQFVRTSRPLYAHLVTLLEGAIARGDLPSGSRLPPERELASRLRISRTTVVSAYRELESRGLLRGYVGRCARPCGIRPTQGCCPLRLASLQSTVSRPQPSARRSTAC